MKAAEIQKQIRRDLGVDATVLPGFDGEAFQAWISTSYPAAQREALTPRLADFLAGRAVGLTVKFSPKP